MQKFEYYRNRFPAFYAAVREGHERSPRRHRGHGLDHDVTVAQLASHIAPDPVTAEKAWCAGMLHSVDRFVEKNDVERATRDFAASLAPLFTPAELEEIIQAALRHSELNQSDQSLTQQCLMDADRVVNLMPAVVIRAGQSQPEIPAFEFVYLAGRPNPDSTHNEPKSVLDDFRMMLQQYLPQLRLPKAKALGQQYGDELRAFVGAVETSNQWLGLLDIVL